MRERRKGERKEKKEDRRSGKEGERRGQKGKREKNRTERLGSMCLVKSRHPSERGSLPHLLKSSCNGHSPLLCGRVSVRMQSAGASGVGGGVDCTWVKKDDGFEAGVLIVVDL